MADIIPKNLLVPPDLLFIAENLAQAGEECYLVGGSLRDCFLARPIADYDLATSATPDMVMHLFARVIPSGLKHGTVTIILPGGQYEITTLRADGAYKDGRHPSAVHFIRDITGDLARRDFTINAIGYKLPVGPLCDPYQGLSDLREQRIRAVGEAKERFKEDALRILRAARFMAKLGFTIEPATYLAMQELAPLTTSLSKERTAHEFLLILAAPYAVNALNLLKELGIIALLWPELNNLTLGAEFGQRLAKLPKVLPLRLGLLFSFLPQKPRSLAERLVLPAATRDHLLALWDILRTDPPLGAAKEREFISKNYSLMDDYLALKDDPARLKALSRRYTLEPLYNDQTLALKTSLIMASCGLKAGPAIGQMRRYLLQKVWENPAVNTPETLLELAQQWKEEALNESG